VRALCAEAPHGPGALTDAEAARLAADSVPPSADYPEWLAPHVARAFGEAADAEIAAFCERADIDLRLNTLRASTEKALAAIETVGAIAHEFVATAARVHAPDAAERAPAVTVIPAYNKGFVEVQDLGSQIAALAAGDVKSAQVLDYCAGGGGKTLALASLMENRGQLYAYDDDARRLAPLYDRAKRAGVRNLQIVNPATDAAALAALSGRMDVVFVDAPCTGSGTWRRRPDTKWRLTPQQLEARQHEQDAVLAAAAPYVKPGGRLVYATCSFLVEENEDRLDAFRGAHPGFAIRPALAAVGSAGLVSPDGMEALSRCATPQGYLRLTPRRVRVDGFFVAVLEKTG
jgi:16S rRNA (cytosine967-C5)-methyltransferase